MRGNKLFKFIDRYVGIPLSVLLGLLGDKKPAAGKRERILVIKLSAMGDTILMLPALRALRAKYQKARISMLATSINKGIIDKCPYVDEIILLDIKRTIFNPRVLVQFIRKLRKNRFDIVFDFDQWLRVSSLLAYFSGARERVGFKTGGQYKHRLFTKRVPHSPVKHELECFFDLIEAESVRKDTSLELWTYPEDEEYVDGFLSRHAVASKDLLIAVHPGCGTHGFQREWSSKRYAELADELIEHCGAKIILTGSKSESSLTGEVSRFMKHDPIDSAGRMSLRQMIALIRRCRLLVSGNTGVMHIAAAVGTRTVALHGPTNPGKWGPWGKGHRIVRKDLACSPCLYLGFEYGCSGRDCMDLIKVNDVFNACKESLSADS